MRQLHPKHRTYGQKFPHAAQQQQQQYIAQGQSQAFSAPYAGSPAHGQSNQSKAVPPPASAGRCPGSAGPPQTSRFQDGICRQIDHRRTAAVHQTSGQQVFLQLSGVGCSSRGKQRLSRQASTRLGVSSSATATASISAFCPVVASTTSGPCPASPPGCSKTHDRDGRIFQGPADYSCATARFMPGPPFRRPFPASLHELLPHCGPARQTGC